MIRTRFAPSPTGYLHLGHVFSAVQAWRLADAAGGQLLLRIEDIDGARCRPEYTDAIYEDLAWLGIQWALPVRCQSAHFADYAEALEKLRRADLIYPCFCTRADIARSVDAPHGPDGAIYPGTCRHLDETVHAAKIQDGAAFAWRLRMDKAAGLHPDLSWQDARAGLQRARPDIFGDIVLARKDTPTSYHLSVTVDDALQGVTDIVRSVDLFEATHVHRLLQACLGLPVPRYHHHDLVLDDAGRRLAKRTQAATVRALRAAGYTPADILQKVGL